MASFAHRLTFTAIVAALLPLTAPGQAQTLGTVRQGYCDNGSPYAGTGSPCRTAGPPAAGHAYERWPNGGPATSSGSSAAPQDLPARGFSSVHDFGR